MTSPHPKRVENRVQNCHYLIRAGTPGIDQDKDVKITVEDNRLVIDAERNDDRSHKTHREFHCGSFRRAMA
jgi:HSP20 family molecular chaperone IbpA